jgi:hypothetical protein
MKNRSTPTIGTAMRHPKGGMKIGELLAGIMVFGSSSLQEVGTLTCTSIEKMIRPSSCHTFRYLV